MNSNLIVAQLHSPAIYVFEVNQTSFQCDQGLSSSVILYLKRLMQCYTQEKMKSFDFSDGIKDMVMFAGAGVQTELCLKQGSTSVTQWAHCMLKLYYLI